MIPTLRDLNALVAAFPGDAVNKAMFGGDATRPPARKHATQRLGLAEPGKGAAANVMDQAIDLADYHRVGPPPVEIVRPSLGRPEDVHRALGRAKGAWRRSFPALALAIERSRRAALRGLRSKWIVSSIA